VRTVTVLLQCPTGDPSIDKPVMRALLKELLRLSAQDGKEYMGVIVRNNRTGEEKFVIDSTNPDNSCIQSLVHPSLIPPFWTPIQLAHTHPGDAGDVVCNGTWRVGTFMNTMASGPDWENSLGFPERNVVISPRRIASYKMPTPYDSVYKREEPGGNKRWVRIPKESLINNAYSEFSRTGQGCQLP